MATDEVSSYSVQILNTDYPILVQYKFVAQEEDAIVLDGASVEEEPDVSKIPFMLFSLIPFIIGGFTFNERRH